MEGVITLVARTREEAMGALQMMLEHVAKEEHPWSEEGEDGIRVLSFGGNGPSEEEMEGIESRTKVAMMQRELDAVDNGDITEAEFQTRNGMLPREYRIHMLKYRQEVWDADLREILKIENDTEISRMINRFAKQNRKNTDDVAAMIRRIRQEDESRASMN